MVSFQVKNLCATKYVIYAETSFHAGKRFVMIARIRSHSSQSGERRVKTMTRFEQMVKLVEEGKVLEAKKVWERVGLEVQILMSIGMVISAILGWFAGMNR